MQTHFPSTLSSILIASALGATVAHAQDRAPQTGSGTAQTMPARQDTRSLSDWDISRLYRNNWSAREMIGTDVRGAANEEIGEVKDVIVGRNGKASQVVVEVGGFLEIGDQHIGVPWQDVQIGPNMNYVQVPLREVENGTYSLYGAVPQGENVWGGYGTWRVNELIGDYASLTDVPRYGMVSDVLFAADGDIEAVVVDRTRGPWGAAGAYGYPYFGYYPSYSYGLPYGATQVGDYGAFDYGRFAQQSEFAGDRAAMLSPQARTETNRGQVAATQTTTRQ